MLWFLLGAIVGLVIGVWVMALGAVLERRKSDAVVLAYRDSTHMLKTVLASATWYAVKPVYDEGHDEVRH